MMLAPFATLVFISTLWLIVSLLFKTVVESRSKISAALKGYSELAATPTIVPVPVRVTQRSRVRAMRADPQWRAAA